MTILLLLILYSVVVHAVAGEHDRCGPLHELYLAGGCTHLMCCHHASSCGWGGEHRLNQHCDKLTRVTKHHIYISPLRSIVRAAANTDNRLECKVRTNVEMLIFYILCCCQIDIAHSAAFQAGQSSSPTVLAAQAQTGEIEQIIQTER